METYRRPVLGELRPERISHEMLLEHLGETASEQEDTNGNMKAGLSRKTQNNITIPLRAVFELICKPPSIVAHPADGIDNLKAQRAAPDPFERDEVEKILTTMRKTEGDELADYFEFSFFSGLRPSEHVALQWSDVDLVHNTVMVQRVRVMAKTRTGRRHMWLTWSNSTTARRQ